MAGTRIVPTKKTSCEIVRQGIAGPKPDQILDAIRAEYWLPSATPRTSGKTAEQPAPPDTANTKVKP
jgi:hypothetical protein